MRGSRKFCQRGSNIDNVFFFVFFLRFAGVTMMAQHLTFNAGLVALQFFGGSGPVLVRNPIYFLLFGGGGSGPPVPPAGSAHRMVDIVLRHIGQFMNFRYFPHMRHSQSIIRSYLVA